MNYGPLLMILNFPSAKSKKKLTPVLLEEIMEQVKKLKMIVM